MEVISNIDYKKLESLIDSFIVDNNIDKNTFATAEKLSAKILKKKFLPVETDEWSREFSLNETIDIVYKFLDSIDHDMAIQFSTLLHRIDEDGTPTVRFVDGKYNPDAESFFNGINKVQFVFFNDPLDATTLLHEMIHMMNNCKITTNEEDYDKTSTYDVTKTKKFLSESASISFELLLNDYLLENGYINENDYNLIYNERLDSTKADAEEVIVINEVIKLYLKDGHLDFINLTNLLNSRDKGSIIGDALRYEFRNYEYLSDILEEEEITIMESEKYVLGLIIADEILKEKDPLKELLWLHDELGNANSNFDYVVEDLNRDLSVKIR